MKKKAFTLIELIAVLVILAILALIVTPLVMNIIRKARISADKRSIDAYGRSVELAIASYLLDNGVFPTDILQLTIEYSGDEVVCSTTQLNSDSSIYLAGCTVGGRSVEGYTYGKEEAAPTYTAYSVGDEVSYNNVDYYVIKDSDTSEESVTLLKKEPITSSEISPYLTSTEEASKVNTSGTYAQIAYYSRDNCVSSGDQSGCSTDYSLSDVKQIVDVWKMNYASEANQARLVTIDDLLAFGYEYQANDTSMWYNKTSNTPSWIYNNSYWYWTQSQYGDESTSVWCVNGSGSISRYVIYHYYVGGDGGFARPVITIKKSALN